jgi:hypothetical protein
MVVQDCMFAWAASRFFIEARRTGELELLLTTPEGAKSLVASEWKWLKGVFFWPLIVLVAPNVVGSIFDMRRGIGGEFALTSIFWLFFFCLNKMAGLAALLWVGMWFGWSERSQTRAMVRIVIVAGGGPYVLGRLVSAALVSVAPTIFFVSNGQFQPWLFLIRSIAQIVNLLFDLWLIRWAMRRLAAELSHAAGEDRLKVFIRLLLRSVFSYHSLNDS